MTRNRSHAENAMHVLPENHISRSICWHAFNDLYFLPNADAKRSYFLMYLFHCRENLNANAPKKISDKVFNYFQIHQERGRKFACEKCEKTFFTRKALNKHALVSDYKKVSQFSTKIQKSNCNYLSKVILDENQFMQKNVHFKTTLLTVYNCKCTLLPLTRDLSYLNVFIFREFQIKIPVKNLFIGEKTYNHLQTHEERERKFACEQCGKAYFNQKQLKMHAMVSHYQKFHNLCSKLT